MDGMKSVFFQWGEGKGGGGVRLTASENFMTIYHCSVCIQVIFGKK